MDFTLHLLNDGFFAAIAAVGFASISNPNRGTFLACALLAAIGHMTRFVLLGYGVHLTLASFAGGIAIGVLSIPAAVWVKSPAEGLSFPALLPMVPGKFAYGTIQALLECLRHSGEDDFMHYFYLLNYNWLTCLLTIVMMVIGVTIPLFTFRNHGMDMLRKARRQLHRAHILKATR